MSKKPALLIIGAFLLLGGVNAVAEAVTGQPLLNGNDSSEAPPKTSTVIADKPSGSWGAPIRARITTAYKTPGPQWKSGFHTGVDMAAPAGTQVYAAGSGEVVTVNRQGPYGKQIVIRHAPGLFTQYAHLLKQQVKPGQRVKAGEEIGLVGSTGTRSSGPHLHFEVRTGPEYGSDMNPSAFLRQQGVTL